MIKESIHKIAVVGGTPFDTEIGIQLLQQRGFDTVGYPLANDPFSQTRLQNSPILLSQKVEEFIVKMNAQNIFCIMIYCVSLASTVDIKKLQLQFPNTLILSPLEFFSSTITQHHRIGLLTANGSCLSKLEQEFMIQNPHLEILGVGLLPIIKKIEEGLLDAVELISLIEFFIHQEVEVIILGCTHFHLFCEPIRSYLEELGNPVRLFDPTELMIESIELELRR